MPDVVLPVLDEREALPWVLERMPAGYAPIVVDNGSRDGSGALAAQLGARVVHEPARGFGAACWAGLRAASADVVCFMDCDASASMKQTTSASAAHSPAQQAAPNPRCGSTTTRAPSRAASAPDPSVEPLSTTIGAYPAGMRSRTHGSASRSSSTGRTTSGIPRFYA